MNKNIKSKKDVWKRQDGSTRLWEGERCGGFWVSDEHQGSLTIIFYTKSTFTVLHFLFFFLKCTLFPQLVFIILCEKVHRKYLQWCCVAYVTQCSSAPL